MNKWIVMAVALIGCGTNAEEPAPSVTPSLAFEAVDTDTDLPLSSPEIASLDAAEGVGEPDGDEVSEATTLASTEEVPLEEPSLDAPAVPVHTFELRRGESLHHFARWSEQPIEQIATLSELPLDGAYAVGTEVKVQLTPEDRAMLESRRDVHHQTRAQAYLDSRGPHSTGFYTVKTGDTAWKIAQSTEAVPVWLIESLNPSVDLERLRPGAELLVPVFQDVTASLDEDEEE